MSFAPSSTFLGFWKAEKLRELISNIVFDEKSWKRRNALRALRRMLHRCGEPVADRDYFWSHGDVNSDLFDFNKALSPGHTLHMWRPTQVLAPHYELLDDLAWTATSPRSMRASPLSIAVSAAFYDIRDFVDALTSLAHGVVVKPGKPRKVFLANCIGRLRIALLRSGAGFFGSHKVDARNNP